MDSYIHFLLLIYCAERKDLLRYAVSIDANDPRVLLGDVVEYWREPGHPERLMNLLAEEHIKGSHVLVGVERIDGAVQWGRRGA